MNGWANNIIDPEQKKSETSAPGDNPKSSAYLSQVERESGVWKPLKEAFPWNPVTSFSFTNAEIINYFVSRRAVDGLSANDTKAMNKSALNLFQCGHIQDIRVCYTSRKQLSIKYSCIPEMSKDRVCKLILILDSELYNVVGAKCRCPARKGPRQKRLDALSVTSLTSRRNEILLKGKGSFFYNKVYAKRQRDKPNSCLASEETTPYTKPKTE